MGNVICNIDATLKWRSKATKRIQRAWLLSNKTMCSSSPWMLIIKLNIQWYLG